MVDISENSHITLKLAYEKIQISEKQQYPVETFICVLNLQDRTSGEIVFFTQLKPLEKSENLNRISKKTDLLLKIHFQSTDFKSIGSISIPFEIFFNQERIKTFSQWITLFDDPEDDIFDGDLEQDDYEFPRVFITFSIENETIIKQEEEKTTLEERLFESFGQNSLKNSNTLENALKNSNILDKFNPKNIDFEDQPEELIKHFDVMLNKINTPEDLITATHKINEFRDELEHPMAHQYMKRSSNFQVQFEEINMIEKYNKEYEEEIGLLKLKIKQFQGIEDHLEGAKNEKKIMDEKYDNLLKSYQEAIISMETKVKVLMKENKDLIEKNFNLELEKTDKEKQIEELAKNNNNLSLEMKNLKELNSLKDNEFIAKDTNFDVFMKEFKEKFERMKEKLLEEEKTKDALLVEQKELLTKYKKQLELNSNNKQAFLDIDSKNRLDLQKIQLECENQINELQKEIENLILSSNEKSCIIKQLEEEKTHNIKQFQVLKNELDLLRKAKNEKVEKFNSLIEQLEKRVLILEKEKNDLEVAFEQNTLDIHSERQDELLQRIKILETHIIEDENIKEKLQSQCLDAHNMMEEKLKELERIKEDFIKKFIEENKIKDIKMEEYSRMLEEQKKKITELEFVINEQKSKLNCENYWNSLAQKFKKKIRELKKSIQVYENDKQRLHKGLYKVTQELIRQTNVTIDQSHTINLLSNEIQRLEANLQAAQEHLEEKTKPKMVNIVKIPEEISAENNEHIEIKEIIKNELDEKLELYVKDQQVPIKFDKIADGQYRFGTRVVQAKIWKDKIAIRMGGGFMMIQEFLRLFTLQELKKLKKTGRFSLDNSKSQTPKENNHTSEEDENNTLKNMSLKKHYTLQNLEQDYLQPLKKDFI